MRIQLPVQLRRTPSVFYLLAFLFFMWPRVFAARLVALFEFNAPLKRFSNSRSFSEAFGGLFSSRLSMERAFTAVRDGEERFNESCHLGSINSKAIKRNARSIR